MTKPISTSQQSGAPRASAVDKGKGPYIIPSLKKETVAPLKQNGIIIGAPTAFAFIFEEHEEPILGAVAVDVAVEELDAR